MKIEPILFSSIILLSFIVQGIAQNNLQKVKWIKDFEVVDSIVHTSYFKADQLQSRYVERIIVVNEDTMSYRHGKEVHYYRNGGA